LFNWLEPLAHGSKRADGITDQVKNGYFHHAFIEVSRSVLHHLDRNNFLGFQILTLDHLPKSSLTQDIQDQVAVSD
jgi:hypothetical protein